MQATYSISNLKVVEFEINSDCNLKCSYCPNSQDVRKEQGTLSLELYENIILQLRDIDFVGRISCDFYNEPLLNTNIEKYISIANTYLPKCYTLLYTNGTKLTKELTLKLFSNKLAFIIVTKHESITTIPLDQYYNELPEDLKQKITYQDHNEITKYNRGGILDKITNNIRPLTPCYLPLTLLSITNKGRLLPCFEDFYQQLEMGDLTTHSLTDIWYSKKYQNFILELKQGLRHKHTPCKSCNRTYDKSDL